MIPPEERAWIARQEFAHSQPYWRDAYTEAQAALAGVKTAGWPEPCEVCGALWRQTPKGRWLIDHGSHTSPVAATPFRRPDRTTEAHDDRYR